MRRKFLKRPTAALIAGGVLAAVMLVGGSAAFLAHERSRDLAVTDRELGNLATSLAEQMDRSFLALGTVQSGLIERMQMSGIDSDDALLRRMAGPGIHAVLRDEIKGLPYVSSFGVVGADGHIVNFSRQWPVPDIDVGDRDYFRALKKNPALDQFVSKPARSRVNGAWTIFLARKFTARDGRFLGMVVGVIDVAYFENYFRRVLPGTGGAITFFRDDGTLLARYPQSNGIIGTSYMSPAFAKITANRDNASVWLSSRIDGSERIVMHRPVGRFPLTISTSTTAAAALADWRREVMALSVLDAVALMAVGGALYFAARSFDRELRKAHERLGQAVEMLSGGFMLFDPDDRLVVYNTAARALNPDCAEHLVPGTLFETCIRKNAERGIYTGVTGDMESWIAERVAEYRAGQGKVQEIAMSRGRWLRAEDRRMPDGSTICLRVDITDLKAREASFRLMFDDNPMPMWLFDRDSLRFLEVNKAAIADYGYSREQFLAMTVADIRPPQDVEMLHGSLDTEYGARTNRGVWRHRRADGSLIDVEIIASRIAFQGYNAELIAAFDVTDHNLTLAAAHGARDAAEAADRMKSQFLAAMSHELRTPLNAILGFSDVIEHELIGPIEPRYRGYAADIHASGEHLLRLINDILDLSKIEAGRFDLREEPADMAEIVESCRGLVADKARGQQVELVCVVANDLPRVRGDRLRLKQIVLNIISNAVKFTEAGGRIEVTASAPAGEGMAVRVTDTGIGMRPDEIAIALEPFRQLDDAWNRRYEGTGLGLPLARKLVQLHGGTLDIESIFGHGTMVLIRIPEDRVVRGKGTIAA
ncbi:MAG: ATP-binding protein [Stellaceae bacterium]